MMIRFVRWQSVAALQSRILSKEIPITKSIIDEAIKNNELQELKTLISSNKHLLSPTTKSELSNYFHNDFSIYYLVKDHKFNAKQLAELIRANPERVDSSWDLFLRHREGHNDTVSQEVIKKLLQEPLDSDWVKILYLYKNLSTKANIQELLFQKILDSRPELFVFFDFDADFMKDKLDGLPDEHFSVVFSKLLGEDLPYEYYVKAIDKFQEHKFDSRFIQNYEAIADEKLEVEEVRLNDIVSYIEQNELDKDKKPEALLLRMKLAQVYGLILEDFETLLKKYQNYQIHHDFGIEFIQNTLIQSYCLKAFKDSNKEILPLIDALLLEQIPIKVLQSMILANSAFGTEKSLEIYNKYINHVSASLNPQTNRSPSGLLNESLLLAFLYNNDRDFAHIIYDKLVQSNILQESELATIKKTFKVYGDAFEEDNWETAQKILHKHICETIKLL